MSRKLTDSNVEEAQVRLGVHFTTPGERGSLTGSGELKKVQVDQLQRDEVHRVGLDLSFRLG